MRRAARALWPGVALMVIGGIGFALMVDAVLEQDDLWTLDDPLLNGLADLRTPWLTTALTVITNAFGPVVLPIVVTVGAAVWIWRTGRWVNPVVVVGSTFLSTALAVLVKVIVDRPRPPEELQVIPGLETSFSFPSGHTAGAAAFILVTGYLVWRKAREGAEFVMWAFTSLAVVALVGLSRMYLGYHFLTDVVAGLCLAIVVLGAVVCLMRLREARPRGRVVDSVTTAAPRLDRPVDE